MPHTNNMRAQTLSPPADIGGEIFATFFRSARHSRRSVAGFSGALLAIGTLSSPCLAAAKTDCNLSATSAAQAGDSACSRAWIDANLRLDDIQVIGTHNSYKQRMPPEEFTAHHALDAHGADTLDYGHRPLDEQLDAGMRELELDVWDDPQGGRWLHPPGALRQGFSSPPWPPAQAEQMTKPGFKVMHLADIDFRSTCMTFAACLSIIRDWSTAHPRHAPITILINAKDGKLGPGSVAALKFDEAAFDRLDAEIRSVFQPAQLITPGDIQGKFPTLRDAARAGHWPTLGQARGRILFALDESDDKIALYRGARKSLEGRAMFATVKEDSPAAGYITLNDPIADQGRIRTAVSAGLLVRTRADADTFEARRNDTARREAAFASGAQFVSTDYFEPDPRFGPYRVRFDGGAIARCNPVRAAAKCAGVPIE
ncbi:phosphatidylinositol-specific phospholipase C1-like protein [Rudaea cellulosilytica]|uniref:phosphatidylinositol-specific phospholipase C1-like protein n=1 Tax=Rudaea cellulosilytica TaxID=540746 RepID=UPI001B7FEA44|nr:phosphatidylinositol-specific phospholipase C1-like protein [Rudaea cellulosilytica]